MKFKKKIISHLNKCYSIAPLYFQGQNHFLVAAEKTDACLLFDMDGRLLETVWEGPGGVMSMVQVPDTEGQFLATRRFYSPNDSAQADIVIATRREGGGFDIRTLCSLPFVHRFDILTANGVRYLVACTLKSGHLYKEDWSSPGKVYAAVLPDDLSVFNEEHPLKLTVIRENLLKNHGYFRVEGDGRQSCLISSEEGVFHLIPSGQEVVNWESTQLLDKPTSDAVLIDLDRDGTPELVTISPFHGDNIAIYKNNKNRNNIWEKVYTYPEKSEFSHAIWACEITETTNDEVSRRPAVIIGCRKGARKLLLFTYDKLSSSYVYETIDEGCGAANVRFFTDGDRQFFVATNREINEIAMYEYEKTPKSR